MNQEASSKTGLRVSYRVDGDDKIYTEDFVGKNRGDRAEQFLSEAVGKMNFNVTTIFNVEE